MKSSKGAHVLPPFVFLKMPPLTAPAYIVRGFERSMTIERTRPPKLPGPSHDQLFLPMPAIAAEAGARVRPFASGRRLSAAIIASRREAARTSAAPRVGEFASP